MSDVSDTDALVVSPGRSNRKAIFGTGIGNALEWYDWNVYAVFAPFIAASFFSKANPVSAILSTLAVFAVGFLARPLGGFVFGWLSDRLGRRFSMSLAVGTAALGSLIIGLSPSYAAIGAAASLLLLVARLIQGLAHGGELPSAQTYISEFAPRERRGLWSSLIYASGTIGVLAGVLMAAVLTQALDKGAMQSYGWRIPFIIGGIAGIYALFMRRRMDESEVFEEDVVEHDAGQPKPKIWPEIVRHRKQALQVIGMTVGLTVAYYAWAISAPAYAISALGIDATGALWASVFANLIFIAVLPLWGKLSDRVGRKPVLIAGNLGLVILLFPIGALVRDSAQQLFLGMTAAMIFLAAPAAIVPAVYAELFPTHIRTVGVGIPYSICVALFGGTAPYLQQWIGATYGRTAFTGYVVLLLVISLVVVSRLPETRARHLHETDVDAPH